MSTVESSSISASFELGEGFLIPSATAAAAAVAVVAVVAAAALVLGDRAVFCCSS